MFLQQKSQGELAGSVNSVLINRLIMRTYQLLVFFTMFDGNNARSHTRTSSAEGMLMQVFFDTEFTTLDKKGVRMLISIGCVAESGREFYAELSDTWNKELCSSFVIETVLPLLQGGECRMTEADLAVSLKEWIESLTDKEVTLRSDAPGFDWPFVEELFTFYGCWPKNLRRTCGSIYFEENRQKHRYNLGLQAFWKDNISRQHHALVDAQSVLFSWKFAFRRAK